MAVKSVRRVAVRYKGKSPSSKDDLLLARLNELGDFAALPARRDQLARFPIAPTTPDPSQVSGRCNPAGRAPILEWGDPLPGLAPTEQRSGYERIRASRALSRRRPRSNGSSP